MLRFVVIFTKSLKLRENRLGGRGPRERLRVFILVLHKRVDVTFQIGDRIKGTAADCVIDQVSESAPYAWHGFVGKGEFVTRIAAVLQR